MSSAETDDPQRETELARTKKVQEDLWSHEIYLRARRKMRVGVSAVLGILSALGLFTAYDMYTNLLQFTQGEMQQSVESRIQTEISAFIEVKKNE